MDLVCPAVFNQVSLRLNLLSKKTGAQIKCAYMGYNVCPIKSPISSKIFANKSCAHQRCFDQHKLFVSHITRSYIWGQRYSRMIYYFTDCVIFLTFDFTFWVYYTFVHITWYPVNLSASLHLKFMLFFICLLLYCML